MDKKIIAAGIVAIAVLEEQVGIGGTILKRQPILWELLKIPYRSTMSINLSNTLIWIAFCPGVMMI